MRIIVIVAISLYLESLLKADLKKIIYKSKNISLSLTIMRVGPFTFFSCCIMFSLIISSFL